MQPRLTDDELVRLVEWEQLSDNEIGRRYGISEHTVARMRKRLGLESGYNPGKAVPLVILTDFYKGWFAGLVDGEGQVTVKHRKFQEHEVKRVWLSPQISISNTNRELMEEIKRVLEGLSYRPSFHAGKASKKGQKDPYTVSLFSQGGIISFLKNILPHLIVKKKVAERVLEFCISRIISRRSTRSRRPYYTEREWELYWEIRELNKRGRRSV